MKSINTISKDNNRKKILVAMGLLLFGTVYLGFFAFSNNIWFDESFSTYLVINYDFKGIIELVQYDMHPPTYYLIAKVFTMLFGSTITVLKLLSVIPFIGMFLLGLFPVRRILGDRTGYLLIVFAIAMPHVLKFSTEIRNYSLAMFAVLGTVIYAIDLLKNIKSRNNISIIFFGMFSLLSMYTHYYALVMTFFVHLMILIYLFYCKEYKVLVKCFIMEIILCICYLPWLSVLINQVTTVKEGFWIPPITVTSLAQLIAVQFYSGDQFLSVIAVICFTNTLVVVALMLYSLITYFKRRKTKNENIRDWNILLTIIGIPYILTFLLFLGISISVRPILLWRYMIILVPALWLLIAFFIKHINNRFIFKIIVGYFVFMIIFNFIRTIPKEYNSDFAEFMSFYKQQVSQKDVFIHTDQASMGVFSCFYENDEYMDNLPQFYYIFNTKSFDDVNSLLDKNENVWLVMMKGVPVPDYLAQNSKVEYVKTLKIVDTYDIYKVKKSNNT